VPLWTNTYSGPGNYEDVATALAVDGSNNVIVAGSAAVNSGYAEYATIKYSGAGVPLWTNLYSRGALSSSYANAVAMDGSNNVIVTGSSDDGGGSEYATIKYSAPGMPLWTNLYSGPAHYGDGATAVAVDASNNVVVAGDSNGGGSSYDYATIKYSSAGVPLWTNRYNGPGNGDDYAYAVAVDGSNNVIVTGFSGTLEYSSAGVPLWTNNYGGSALAVDRSNNVIVTGSSFFTVKYAGVPSP
jgi:hypothetical protein